MSIFILLYKAFILKTLKEKKYVMTLEGLKDSINIEIFVRKMKILT